MGREPKPLRAEWTETNNGAFFETANHATSDLNYQYEKWQSHASAIMWAQERGMKWIYVYVCVCVM